MGVRGSTYPTVRVHGLGLLVIGLSSGFIGFYRQPDEAVCPAVSTRTTPDLAMHIMLLNSLRLNIIEVFGRIGY